MKVIYSSHQCQARPGRHWSRPSSEAEPRLLHGTGSLCPPRPALTQQLVRMLITGAEVTCGGGPRVVGDPAAVHVQEDLTLALGVVPPHVTPTLALTHRALTRTTSTHLDWGSSYLDTHLSCKVCVADHVDVCLQTRLSAGAGLERVEVLGSGRGTHQSSVLLASPVPGAARFVSTIHTGDSLKIYPPPGGALVALAHAPLTVGVGVAPSDAEITQVVVLNGVEKKCSRYVKKI